MLNINNQIKSWLLLITIIMCLLVDSHSVSASTVTDTLGNEDFVEVSSYTKVGKNYRIDWSFSASNPDVGITVYAMTAANFFLWTEDGSANVYLLSDGTYEDSGTFQPEFRDIWYIVFFVLYDDSGSSSEMITLSIEVAFILNPILRIVLPLASSIILTLVVIGKIILNRRKEKRFMETAITESY